MSQPISFRGTAPTGELTTSTQNLDRKFQEAARLYEDQFLREMVKAMRSTISPGGLTEPSMVENIYRQKLDEHYVDQWIDQGGIGFGDLIYQQLKERFGNQLPAERPTGPINLEGARIIKKNGPDANSLQFQIQPPPMGEAKAVGMELRSPWAGRIQQKVALERNKEAILIQHENGWQSWLQYQGPLKIEGELNNELGPGQLLGQIPRSAQNVTWQLRRTGLG